MDTSLRIIIKTWDELSEKELAALNESHLREWKISSMSKEYHGKNIFFLLKDSFDTILAQGQLVPIDGVRFNDETFFIYGIGGIIANHKKRGYGRRIMLAIKEYLSNHHASGVGFIGLPEFYQKCGFFTNKEVIKRFVYLKDGKRITNIESDHVCYLDGRDKFMEKVLASTAADVLLPRSPEW